MTTPSAMPKPPDTPSDTLATPITETNKDAVYDANDPMFVDLLLRAVRDNNGVVVDYLIKAVPGMQFRHADSTLLHVAAAANAVDTGRVLLNAGHPINALDKSNATPLLVAVCARSRNVVRLLLQHNATVNDKDHRGNTPLHVAAKTCQEDIARDLIEHGAAINETNQEGLTPLCLAVVHTQCLSLIDMLLQHHANIGALNPAAVSDVSKTLLLPAVRSNLPAVVAFLVQAGNVDLTADDFGRLLLCVASSINLVPTMRVLMDAGANINDAASANDETPLMAAVRANAVNAMAFLLDKHTDVHVKNSDGDTALHLATMLGRDITGLLDKGARIDEKTKCGETPVYLAVRHHRVDLLNTLLTRGASPNITNDHGVSPMLVALTSRQPSPPEIILSLLRYGASSNIHTMLASISDKDLAERLAKRIAIPSLEKVLMHQWSLDHSINVGMADS